MQGSSSVKLASSSSKTGSPLNRNKRNQSFSGSSPLKPESLNNTLPTRNDVAVNQSDNNNGSNVIITDVVSQKDTEDNLDVNKLDLTIVPGISVTTLVKTSGNNLTNSGEKDSYIIVK